MSTYSKEKTPEFDGTKFVLWEMKFVAYARVNGFGEALESGHENRLPATQSTVLNESDAGELAQKKAREMNDRAMQALILASKNELLMNIIKKEMKHDADWSGAKAWRVMRELCREFQPDDNVAESELEEEILALKFKKGEDPKEIHKKMSALEVKCNTTVSEVKRRAVVVRL